MFSSETARAFRRGLLFRSPWLVGLSVALAATLWFVVEQAIGERWFDWMPENLVTLTVEDSLTHVSYAIHRLNQDPPAEAFYFAGTSEIRDALLDEAELAQRLSRRIKTPLPVHSLASSGQTLPETLFLLDHLPPAKSPSIFLVGVSFRMTSKSLSQQVPQLKNWERLSPSAEVGKVLREAKLDHGVAGEMRAGWLSFLPYYLWYRFPQFIQGGLSPIQYLQHRDFNEVVPTIASEQARLTQLWGDLKPDLDANHREIVDANFAFLRRISSLGTKKGFRVVWVETPVSPLVSGSFPQLYRYFHSKLMSSAREEGVYAIPSEENLPFDQFHTLIHLRREAREAFSQKLVDKLSPLISAESGRFL